MMGKYEKHRKIISERIKKIRLDKKWTQEQFAAEIGVATNTISRIERNDNSLTADVAMKIAEKLYISMDYLFGFGPDEEEELPCGATCEELINAQNIIEVQETKIQELNRKIEGIKSILGCGSREIKLNKQDGPI